MNEFLDILFKAIGVILIAFTTYVIVPAIKDLRATRLDEKQREELTFWVHTGVLWAKQWLQTSTGQQKKTQVFMYVKGKIKELGLPFTDEDIDKAIEACYSSVKDIVDAASGEEVGQKGGSDK